MRSGTGKYSVTIRKRADGAYNNELFAVYPDGSRVCLGDDQGIKGLPAAQARARAWMFEYELHNTFSTIEEDGDNVVRAGLKKRLGSMLGKIAKDRGITKEQVIDDALKFLRSFQ